MYSVYKTWFLFLSFLASSSVQSRYSLTYNLTIQDDFLGRMKAYRDPYNNNIQQKFTFLVPSNEAWENVRHTMGSAFKKLFMGEYYYNVLQF